VVDNFKGSSFKECQVLSSFFQNGSKKFHNLRLLDLTKHSPNTVENFIQAQEFLAGIVSFLIKQWSLTFDPVIDSLIFYMDCINNGLDTQQFPS